MVAVESVGEEIRRFGTALDAQGLVAYQPALAGEFTSQWLDPRFWARNGALLGGIDGIDGIWVVREGRRSLQLRQLRQPGLPAALVMNRLLWLGEARCVAWQQMQASLRAQAAGLCAAPVLAVRWRRLGLFYSAEALSVQSDTLPTLAQQLRVGSVTLDVWAAVGRCLRRHLLPPHRRHRRFATRTRSPRAPSASRGPPRSPAPAAPRRRPGSSRHASRPRRRRRSR